MSEEKNPGGRPSKFNDKIADKIIKLAEEGKTEEQISEIIGVHVNTLRNWKGKHPEFLWAIREAKLTADELVEASLFSRAVGYSHPEVKVFCQDGQIIEHVVQKHYPPEVQAQQFWLKNRRPDEWREKQPGEDDKTITHQGELKVTKIDLDERVKQLKGEK